MADRPIPNVALPSSAAMIRTLTLVAVLAGLLVVLVYEFTQPYIAENKRRAIERAVFKVIPGATSRAEFTIGPNGLVANGQSAQGTKVYAGYGADDELRGIAMEAAAQGYQDVVRILYGYDPQRQCVTGIDILKSTETPGLGDKIGTDPAFLANFQCLDGHLNEEHTGLAHAIVTVKHGSKTAPWQIDAISGATISSRAVGKMLNQSGQKMFPLVQSYLQQFREKPLEPSPDSESPESAHSSSGDSTIQPG